METQPILPNVPVAEQQNPFAIDALQESLINKTFNRTAYQNEQLRNVYQQQSQQAQQQNVPPQYAQPQNVAPQTQNEPRQFEWNTPAFQDQLERDIANIRQRAQQPQQNPAQPSEVLQNEPPKNDRGTEFYKQLFGQEPLPNKVETQPQAAEQQTPPGMSPEYVSKLSEYLDRNEQYINQIQLEAGKRGINPAVIMDQLSKKSITEMVDFALGKINNQVAPEVPSALLDNPYRNPSQVSITDIPKATNISINAGRPYTGVPELNL